MASRDPPEEDSDAPDGTWGTPLSHYTDEEIVRMAETPEAGPLVDLTQGAVHIEWNKTEEIIEKASVVH